jgi:hypothetical protein
MEADTIISMSFFIRNLQHQIGSYHEKSLLIYHGQGLSAAYSKKLLKTKSGLTSSNNFLSIDQNREMSLHVFYICFFDKICDLNRYHRSHQHKNFFLSQGLPVPPYRNNFSEEKLRRTKGDFCGGKTF